MQNRIFLFFLIVFNLLSIHTYGSDQISFDVTEIEIIDGGNKIVGKNRGTITTDNGITIEANQFEFDKIKNIIKAEGNIIIEDQFNNYNFSAQNVLYIKNKERIELKGKVEASIDTNYKFNSDNIIILRNDMLISSDAGATIFWRQEATLL